MPTPHEEAIAGAEAQVLRCNNLTNAQLAHDLLAITSPAMPLEQRATIIEAAFRLRSRKRK